MLGQTTFGAVTHSVRRDNANKREIQNDRKKDVQI